MAKVPRMFKPPVGEVYFRAENPRGETGFYLISDGTVNPYRLKIRAPSFVTMNIFEKIRITSYNVCYTKLLRSGPSTRCVASLISSCATSSS